MSTRSTWLPAVLALAALGLGACTTSLSGKAITGQVIDESTHRPLSGAIVVAMWEGDFAHFPENSRYCYHVLSTTTDTEGTYRLPAWEEKIRAPWQKNMTYSYVRLVVYYPGYTSQDRILHGSRKDNPTLVIKPDPSPRAERFVYLHRVFLARMCDGATSGRSLRNLVPFDEAIYKELKSLARTPDEKTAIKFAREITAGDAAADYRGSEQVREMIKKYLEEHPE